MYYHLRRRIPKIWKRKDPLDNMLRLVTVGYLSGIGRGCYGINKPNAPDLLNRLVFYKKWSLLFGILLAGIRLNSLFCPKLSERRRTWNMWTTEPLLLKITAIMITKLRIVSNDYFVPFANNGSMDDACMHSFIEVMTQFFMFLQIVSIKWERKHRASSYVNNNYANFIKSLEMVDMLPERFWVS